MHDMHDEKKRLSRELGVKLNDAEIKVLGRELGRKYAARQQLDDKRKLVAADFKSQIGKHDEDIRRMSSALEKGEEIRPVECVEYYEAGAIITKRTDTNEVIDTRAATLQERQRGLFGGDHGEGADTSAAPDDDVEDSDEGYEDFRVAHDGGAGTVRADDGERVGEVVMSSMGDGVFVGDESPDGDNNAAQDAEEAALSAQDLEVQNERASATIAEQAAAKNGHGKNAKNGKTKTEKKAGKAKRRK